MRFVSLKKLLILIHLKSNKYLILTFFILVVIIPLILLLNQRSILRLMMMTSNRKTFLPSYLWGSENCHAWKKGLDFKTKTDFGMKFKGFLENQNVIMRTRNCSSYFSIISANSKVQKNDLILAFSHQIHEQVGIFEMMLTLYFRPGNLHCIHIDKKASLEVKKAVQSIVTCYQSHFQTEDIFIYSNPISVVWAHSSVLEADLRCLEALLAQRYSWDYYLNWAGTELPMISYEELQRRLKSVDGQSIIPTSTIFNYDKWKRKKVILNSQKNTHVIIKDFNLQPPPYNLTVYKGMKSVILNRSLAHFLIHHKVSKLVRRWLADRLTPEEHFFATLGRVKMTRYGRFDGQYRVPDISHGICTRYALWIHGKRSLPCHGFIVHNVCLLAVRDLHSIQASNCNVANKFHINLAAAIACQMKDVLRGEEGEEDNV